MSTPDATASPQDQLVRMIVANHTPEELAAGFLRYEVVRRMSPMDFANLWMMSLDGRGFDELVDQALQDWTSPNAPASATSQEERS